MDFKEFLQKFPEDVKKAKACKDLSEFRKIVDKAGISYKDDSELKKAFDFVKNSQGELSDDDLNAVAGGKDDTFNMTFTGGGNATVYNDNRRR